MFDLVNGIPKPKRNLEAFVDAPITRKNVTFEKGSGVDGIVPAGAIVGKFLDTYNAFGEVVEAAEAQGILLVDVDTTKKAASGAVMIEGWINSDKLDYEVTDELKDALKDVKFIANGNHDGGKA